MKINRLLFNNPNYSLEGDIDFTNENFTGGVIRKIASCHVKISGSIFEDLLMLKVHIKANVVGICSYTLEDVDYQINRQENLEISNEIEDDDTIFYEKNNIFEIDPYVLSFIVSSMPSKLIKKGAKPPKSGECYRVLTEDEYEKEKAETKDPRWAALDDIEL